MSTKHSSGGAKKPAIKPSRPAVEADNPLSAIAATANALFGPDGNAYCTLGNGRKVVFKPAKMKHLTSLVSFFETGLKTLSDEHLLQLVTLATSFRSRAKSLEDMQAEAIDKGADDLVRKAIGSSQSLLMMFRALLEVLPKFASTLSDITVEEYDELDITDCQIIILGIFAVNYTFFTQSLRPILLMTLGMAVQDATLNKTDPKNT